MLLHVYAMGTAAYIIAKLHVYCCMHVYAMGTSAVAYIISCVYVMSTAVYIVCCVLLHILCHGHCCSLY